MLVAFLLTPTISIFRLNFSIRLFRKIRVTACIRIIGIVLHPLRKQGGNGNGFDEPDPFRSTGVLVLGRKVQGNQILEDLEKRS